MQLFRMRSLLVISVLCITWGCRQPAYLQLPQTDAATPCSNLLNAEFKTVLYNCHINVVGNHLSGLLLFKQTGKDSTRVVFSTEMGIKFFDFEFTPSGFKVIYCIDKLNKKVVLRQLEKDIGLLLFRNVSVNSISNFKNNNENYMRTASGKAETYYVADSTCMTLLRIEDVYKGKPKVTIHLTERKEGMADSVYIEHKNYEFNISLKQIQR